MHTNSTSYKKNRSDVGHRHIKDRKIRNKVILSEIDRNLLIIIIFLLVFGAIAVFSAGIAEGIKDANNPIHYAIRHIIFVGIGVFAMISTSKIDYKKFKNYTMQISLTVLALLIATKIPGLGKTILGSSRWLTFLPIQPSEFAKLACVMLASSALSSSSRLFEEKMILNFGLIAAMILIILSQPDLSVAMLITFTCVALMVVGGVSSMLLGSLGVAALPVLYMKIAHTPYQLKRITGWLDPWADAQGTGYNLIQSWYAIASGGLIGVGYGMSKQKHSWLPFGHTDFIYSVIAEEFGFIGGILLIGLFVALIMKGLKISAKCEDLYGKLLAFGITFIIGLQAFINIGVAIGALPVTGVTLPLISYGGSSMIVTMIMLGILLNISRQRIQRLEGNEQ